MPELDAFERSLETAFRSFANRGVAPVDAVAFAERAAARPRRRAAWPSWPRTPGRLAAVPAIAWVLLATGLMVGLVVGGLAVGLWRAPDRALVVEPTPTPTAISFPTGTWTATNVLRMPLLLVFRTDGTWRFTRDGVEMSAGMYSTDEETITFLTDTMCEEQNAEQGTYTWTYASGRLTLTKQDDQCTVGRVTTMDGRAWTPAPPDSMLRPRTCHGASLLEDGRVLLVGGDGGHRPNESTAELYDPGTAAFTPAGTLMSEDLACFATIELGDGRILVYGGADSFSSHRPEIWDPATGAFAPAGDWLGIDDTTAAGPLPDGRILVVLPRGANAELFDPTTGAHSATGSLSAGRHFESLTMLRDGRVLVAGGEPASNDQHQASAWPTALEVYDPATGAFATAGNLAAGRAQHTAILLADGRVLIVGGASDQGVPLASAEVWDPATGTAGGAGSMSARRISPTATLLPDGRVLIAGGASDREVPVASAEIWDPATGTFSPTGSMAVPRRGHTATLLRDGTVIVTGGTTSSDGWLGDTAAYLASAEIWDPATGTFRPVARR